MDLNTELGFTDGLVEFTSISLTLEVVTGHQLFFMEAAFAAAVWQPGVHRACRFHADSHALATVPGARNILGEKRLDSNTWRDTRSCLLGLTFWTCRPRR
ncbi:unnamed protein product [Effrenium voratum]|nr:unnamed protein product [Effrenium voratum]